MFSTNFLSEFLGVKTTNVSVWRAIIYSGLRLQWPEESNQALKEENQILKTQKILTKEKEDLETRLAKAEFEASFLLAEKTKVEEKLQEIENRADKVNQEVLTVTHKL